MFFFHLEVILCDNLAMNRGRGGPTHLYGRWCGQTIQGPLDPSSNLDVTEAGSVHERELLFIAPLFRAISPVFCISLTSRSCMKRAPGTMQVSRLLCNIVVRKKSHKWVFGPVLSLSGSRY